MTTEPTNALTVQRAPQAQSLIAPMFTNEQVELMKRTVCPPEATVDEFKLFLFQCERSGLDPFKKQMFCVPRRKKIRKGARDEYITVHEAQPAEAGLLARAARFPDYRGVVACAVFEGDKIEMNFAEGIVKHSFDPISPKRRMTPTNGVRPLGAWARIQTADGAPPLLIWREYDDNTFKSMGAAYTMTPATWIEKIARVAALRTRYPETFGGLYIAEEIAPARLSAPAAPSKGPSTLRDLTPQAQPLAQTSPQEPVATTSETVGDHEPTGSATEPAGEGSSPDDLESVQWGEAAETAVSWPPPWLNEPCGMGKATMTAADGSKKPGRELTWADLMAGSTDGQRRQHLERLAEGDASWVDDPAKCKADEQGKAAIRLLIDKCADRARVVLDYLESLQP